MLLKTISLSWRSLRKNGAFTILNLSGLVVGMTAFLLIIHYVRFERSYEAFHVQADNIYRITLDLYKGAEYVATDCETQAPIGPLLKETVPEVLDYVRLYSMDEEQELVIGSTRVITDRAFMVDQSIFNIFTLEVIDGTVNDALTAPHQAVITSSLALKAFGTTEAAGKSFELKRKMYKVNAVIADLPPNTHLKLNLLISHSTLSALRNEYSDTNWRGNNEYTYLLMAPGTDVQAFNNKLRKISNDLKDKIGEDRFSAETMPSIHLHSNKTYEPETNGNANVVYFMAIIAAFIITIAWINYINLATARAVERAREVGMRKVMGSMRWQLVVQFLIEATALNVLAAVIALVLFRSALPLFRELSGQPLTLDVISDRVTWYLLGGLILTGTISSGIYPAFVLSSFRPVQVLKGKFQTSVHGQWLRKGLVVVQFGVTFLLITGLLTVYSQIRHLRQVDLGMNLEQVIAVQAPRYPGNDSIFLAGLSKFKTDLLSLPLVESVGRTSSLPGFDYNHLSSTSFARIGHESEGKYEYYFHAVDGTYFESMGMKIIEGRPFEDGGSNTDQAIVNETAAKRLGFSSPHDAVGQKIGFYSRWPGEPAEIIGVVADYYQRSPKENVIPMAYRYHEWIEFFTVRVKTEDASMAMQSIREVFLGSFPGDTFVGYFIDDMYNRQYAADQQLGRVITSSCLLAVFIACLGLFGLSAYTITQRTKEIGIRKVLGASVISIVRLLSGGFAKLVLVSSVIAIPLTYLAMREWLSSYATRVELTPWMFIAPMLIVLATALITVSIQTLRSATANPTNSLRQE
jgi:putative ABC transport system permease protein